MSKTLSTAAIKPQKQPEQDTLACRGDEVQYQRLFQQGLRTDYLEVEGGWTSTKDESVDKDQRELGRQEVLVAFRSGTAHVWQQELEKIEEQYDVGPPKICGQLEQELKAVTSDIVSIGEDLVGRGGSDLIVELRMGLEAFRDEAERLRSVLSSEEGEIRLLSPSRHRMHPRQRYTKNVHWKQQRPASKLPQLNRWWLRNHDHRHLLIWRVAPNAPLD
jgi:hypothetical protein